MTRRAEVEAGAAAVAEQFGASIFLSTRRVLHFAVLAVFPRKNMTSSSI